MILTDKQNKELEERLSLLKEIHTRNNNPLTEDELAKHRQNITMHILNRKIIEKAKEDKKNSNPEPRLGTSEDYAKQMFKDAKLNKVDVKEENYEVILQHLNKLKEFLIKEKNNVSTEDRNLIGKEIVELEAKLGIRNYNVTVPSNDKVVHTLLKEVKEKRQDINLSTNNEKFDDTATSAGPIRDMLTQNRFKDEQETAPWKKRMQEMEANLAAKNATTYTDQDEMGSLDQQKADQYEEKAVTDNTAPYILEEGARIYRERNTMYGSAYKRQGDVMKALFPNGVNCVTLDDFNRITILSTIISKLIRYTNDFSKPHDDSILDISVYAAMLLETDRGLNIKK